MSLTEEEKYHFDVAGFVVRPSILNAEEIAEIHGHLDRLVHDPQSLPSEQRHSLGGPAALLIDHPRVVDVLEEVIGPRIRLEGSFAMWRSDGERHVQGLHQGGWNQGDPVFGYRVHQGRMFSGMVRVAFELTDVAEDDGATVFIAGSHKANFTAPPEHLSLDDGDRSPLLRGYECPAGSAVFFTENLLHAGPKWRRETPRVAVFNAYNNLAVNFHRQTIRSEMLAALPREKQAWFREPWLADFRTSPPTSNSIEHFVDSDDRPMAP
ncbi:MAG: hypothetical protein GEU73_17425 [Chloroflexi bacterium]|nr:hypothetical protein [Chloroflexota bacterium]